MDVDQLVIDCYKIAADHGFHDHDKYAQMHGREEEARHVAMKLMLIVSELCEAMEAIRKGDKDNYAEELVDVAIRLLDLWGEGQSSGLIKSDLSAKLEWKMETNRGRPLMHGGKLF